MSNKEMRDMIRNAESPREVLNILRDNKIDLDAADARNIFWLTHRRKDNK